jgi:hypothetical protein
MLVNPRTLRRIGTGNWVGTWPEKMDFQRRTTRRMILISPTE